jgi:hypothetical protein
LLAGVAAKDETSTWRSTGAGISDEFHENTDLMTPMRDVGLEI